MRVMNSVYALAATAVLACSPVKAADEEQPEGLPPTVAGLIEAVGALTKSSSAIVDDRRTAVRTYKIRQTLTTYLLEGTLTELPTVPNIDSLLCEPRKKQLALLSSITYLNTVTAQVRKTAKSDITSETDFNNIIKAFKTLFSDYRLEIDVRSGTAETPGLEAKIFSDCQADAKSFAISYYGVKPQEETAVLAAFTALYEMFKQIVAPIIVEGAKFVDEEKRLARIRKFLSDPKNQDLIKANSANLRDFIVRHERARLAEGVGHFVEARTALLAGLKPAKDVKECAAFAALPDRKLPDNDVPKSEFVNCFAAVWAANKERVGAVVKAAAEYDQVADIGATLELKQFDVINTSLKKIASNEDDPVTFNQVWKAAMRLAAIGQKIEAATSKENRDKVNKAVKEFVDAL